MFLGIEVNDIDANVWIDYLLPGLINTLKAAAISIVLAGIFGFVFGIGPHVADRGRSVGSARSSSSSSAPCPSSS